MSLRDRIAAANAAARKVTDEGRADRQQRRDRFHADRARTKAGSVERSAAMPEHSAQDYQPGETAPVGTPPSAAQVDKGRRKWPWIVGGIVLLFFVIGVANGGDESSPSTLTPATPQGLTPAVPAQATLPADLVGKNAQIVDDQLRKVGIVNIRYVSQDPQDKVVLLLMNWTVTKVEPAPGVVVSTTDTVVITATKKASLIAPQPTPPPAAPISTARREAPTPPAEPVEPPSERATVQPQPVEPQPDSGASTGREVYYKTCDAAKAAGAAPLKLGEPGYRPELDRDKDGTACDK